MAAIDAESFMIAQAGALERQGVILCDVPASETGRSFALARRLNPAVGALRLVAIQWRVAGRPWIAMW